MALMVVARVVALLPWAWLRWPGAALGFLAGSMLRIRRTHVEQGMRRAGLDRVPALARAMYASLGTSVFEFLWLAGRGAPPVASVELDVRARAVLAARAHDARRGAPVRGLVIATAHTGNWDFVGCVLAREHIELSVVTKRLSARWLDQFWQRRRASFGIELFDGPGVFARAVAAVGRGRAVGILLDQVPDRTSAVTELSFLGQTARCDTTPALLAARTGAPLMLALGHRLPDGTHRLDVPLVLEPPARPSRRWVEQATRECNLALERFVRERPSQWMWMHRRWKTAADLGLPEPARRPAECACETAGNRDERALVAGPSPLC